jgi:hypothetical protein
MTLVEQFPNVSMSMRKQRKLNLKFNPRLHSKDNHHETVSAEQKFYDKEFRVFHFKLVSFIFILLATLFLMILNGQALWRLISS